MPFSFKPSITMTGQPLKHKVSVSDFKQFGDEYYMRISKSDPSMIGILNIKRIDSEGQRMLSHTDVIETITGIRDSKFTELVAGIVSDENGAPPDGGLACCDEGGCSDQSPGTKRIPRIVLAQMPETVTITTPTVGDVQGIDVKVVLGNAHSPLYMHLCEALIKYLSEAVHFQINNMEIKRTRHSKKTKDTNVQPGTPVEPIQKKPKVEPGTPKHRSPKKHDTVPNFEYSAEGTTLSLKSVRTKDKDGLRGLKRYFKAKTDDGNVFTFSFGSSSATTAASSEVATVDE